MPIRDSIHGFWPCNEGNGSAIADQSGNGNHGSHDGSWTTLSNGLTSVAVTGGTKITIPSKALSSAGAAISLWVQTALWGGQLLGRSDSYPYLYCYNSALDRLVGDAGGGGTAADLFDYTARATGVATHIVVNWDTNVATVWINGTQYAARDPGWTGTFTVTQIGAGGSGSFAGSLAAVGVWERALTSGEIAALYATPYLPMLRATLMAHHYARRRR